jgi:hypothetical protein
LAAVGVAGVVVAADGGAGDDGGSAGDELPQLVRSVIAQMTVAVTLRRRLRDMGPHLARKPLGSLVRGAWYRSAPFGQPRLGAAVD